MFDALGVVGAGEGEGGEEVGEQLGAGGLLDEHHEKGAGGDLVDGEADGVHAGGVGVEDFGDGEDAAELEDAGEGLAHAAELAVLEQGEGAVEEPIGGRRGGVGEVAFFLSSEDAVGEDGADEIFLEEGAGDGTVLGDEVDFEAEAAFDLGDGGPDGGAGVAALGEGFAELEHDGVGPGVGEVEGFEDGAADQGGGGEEVGALGALAAPNDEGAAFGVGAADFVVGLEADRGDGGRRGAVLGDCGQGEQQGEEEALHGRSVLGNGAAPSWKREGRGKTWACDLGDWGFFS